MMNFITQQLADGRKKSAGKRFKNSQQKGVAAVELALTITLLLLVIAGIFEFGRAFWYYDALAKATRDGARYLSNSSSKDIGTAKDIVDKAMLAAGIPDDVAGFNKSTDINVSFITETIGSIVVEHVTVSVFYPITIGGVIPLGWFGGNNSFSATLQPHTTMRYMQGI